MSWKKPVIQLSSLGKTSLSLRSAAPCVAGVPETQCHQGRDSGQRGRAIQVEDGARLKIDLI